MLTNQNLVDLRSDTVTRPTPSMRAAMHEAPVGDDVYGEDPTVNELESKAAAMLGKEAAVFVASGTQSNLVALLSHCGRGDEYIAGMTSHTYQFEGGGGATLGGMQPHPMPFQADGTLDLTEVAAAVKPDDVHFAVTRLLCLENTQSGRATGPGYFHEARAVCDRFGLKLHLDGARLFNAAVATGSTALEIAAPCDSVSICLSKGLGAPVGSVLVGDENFIRSARKWRKMVGGGMRQAGVIAAAGIHALDNHIDRLAEDHDRARLLAEALNERYQGMASHHTNMVFLDLPDIELERLSAHMAKSEIWVNGTRWVMHLDVTDEGLARVIAAIKQS